MDSFFCDYSGEISAAERDLHPSKSGFAYVSHTRANWKPLDKQFRLFPRSVDTTTSFSERRPVPLYAQNRLLPRISTPPLPSFPVIDPHDYPFSAGPVFPPVVIDASEPPASLPRPRGASRRDSSYIPRPRRSSPDWHLGEVDQNMLVFAEGVEYSTTLDFLDDFDFDWHC